MNVLKGTKPTRYGIHVNGPWRITFGFVKGHARRVISSSTIERTRQWARRFILRLVTRHARLHTPVAILREDVLSALGIGVTKAARHLGVSRQALHRVLTEQASISPEMAVRIGKLCGDGPGLWIRMQARYDTWHAERTVDTARIPTLHPAA